MRAYVRLFLALGTVLMISALFYTAANSDWGQTASIDFRLDPSSREQILFERIQKSLSPKLDHLKGKKFWRVSMEDVLKDVLSDARVHQAQVTRSLPNKIIVSLIPKSPVFGILSGRDKIHPVGADGSLLPVTDIATISDLPLLAKRPFLKDESLRKRAVELLNQIPREGAFNRARIAELHYSDKDGFSILMTKGATLIRIGDDEIGPKASRIERVLNYLEDQQLQSRVIDARFSKKVVVRLRNGT